MNESAFLAKAASAAIDFRDALQSKGMNRQEAQTTVESPIGALVIAHALGIEARRPQPKD